MTLRFTPFDEAVYLAAGETLNPTRRAMLSAMAQVECGGQKLILTVCGDAVYAEAMKSVQHQTTTTVNRKLWNKYQPEWVLPFLTEEEQRQRSQIVLRLPTQGQLVLVRIALVLITVITLALFYWIMKG